MQIRVDCYAGYRGEETPRRLAMGEHCIDVITIQDRWLAPDHRYFKIVGDDGGVYIVRHDPHLDIWQLTGFKDHSLVGHGSDMDTVSEPSVFC